MGWSSESRSFAFRGGSRHSRDGQNGAYFIPHCDHRLSADYIHRRQPQESQMKRIQSAPTLGRKKADVRDRCYDSKGWVKQMSQALSKAIEKRGIRKK